MCTAENTQHAAHTFISQFNPQMYTIQTEYCSIQLNLFQGLMFVMFYTCPLSNSNWTCLPNSSLISHRDLAHFLPTHVLHFMACQRPSYLRVAHTDLNMGTVLGQDWTPKKWPVGSTYALWPLKTWPKFRTMTITPGYRLVREAQ